MSSTCPSITLVNSVKMPQVGLGVWRAAEGAETVQNVKMALKAGYRHIDTAAYYKNEASVGQAIRESGVPREEIFVTTKLWNTDHGYEQTLAAFDASLKRLGLDYVDLYLIHWPGMNTEELLETWRAMEELYMQRKVRAIGVSNFEPHHLRQVLDVCSVPPMVNQVEMHPHFQQEELREFCERKKIAITAWRPLGKGTLLDDETLVAIAKKHNKTAAQVIIRWLTQLNVVAIPKSSHEERIIANFSVFDFTLDEDDMKRIADLNRNERMGGHPDTFFGME